MDEKVKISKEDFDLEDIKKRAVTPSDGVIVSFVGVVRDHNKGLRVIKLEIQRYEGMTLQQMQRVRDEAVNNFQVTDIIIHHRVGEFDVGDNILGIAVSAADYQDAFDACRYCVDRIKEIVPLWRKEATEL
ncbi:MAG: molybdenum cofactor biosynthesis protein MoaE [Thermoplasmata archaeon]